MHTEEELKAQVARLNAAFDSLTTKVVERDATIERLEHRYTRLVRLEIAARLLGLNYQVCGRWCTAGYVETAERQGAAWLVNPENLKAVAAQRGVLHTRFGAAS
jgi:predicted NAD/FAD-dependent oxidoreductase